MDSDSWILEAGDEIIEAKSVENRQLSDIEKLIYMVWVLDYAVRNSGTKEALDDFPEFESNEFMSLGSKFEMTYFSKIFSTKNDNEFCQIYYKNFEKIILVLKEHYKLKNG